MNAATTAAVTAMFAAPPIISTALVEHSTPAGMTTALTIFLALAAGLVVGSALGIQIARTSRAKDRADAERLDFLEVAGYSLVCSKQMRQWCVLDMAGRKADQPLVPTAREAIDLAASGDKALEEVVNHG